MDYRDSTTIFGHAISCTEPIKPAHRSLHDDVIKWKHFPRYRPFVRGIHRSTVNSTHIDQWREALMFSFICAWINGWVNNREAGDLGRHRAHYDVTVMHFAIVTKTGIFQPSSTSIISVTFYMLTRLPWWCANHSWQWRHNGRDSVSNHQPHDCILNRLFARGSKKTSELRVTGLCAGNSPVTGEFPAQMASNSENFSIWWRHHIIKGTHVLISD